MATKSGTKGIFRSTLKTSRPGRPGESFAAMKIKDMCQAYTLRSFNELIQTAYLVMAKRYKNNRVAVILACATSIGRTGSRR